MLVYGGAKNILDSVEYTLTKDVKHFLAVVEKSSCSTFISVIIEKPSYTERKRMDGIETVIEIKFE